jgi:hypothetical protein
VRSRANFSHRTRPSFLLSAAPQPESFDRQVFYDKGLWASSSKSVCWDRTALRRGLAFRRGRRYVLDMFKCLERPVANNAVQSDHERAREVEGTFRVLPGLYVIGSLEQGVTVYSQQVRAHNLAWALWELQQRGNQKIGRVAVVGGGIAGLTIASCILSLLDKSTTVTVFEQLWDLCPIQQGSDARWLHPRIYDWPAEGSRAPSASLPVLDWSEGRASDVARTILREFSAYSERFARPENRLNVYLGLRHFQINAANREISWIAHRATRAGQFFHLSKPNGETTIFDTIVLATGFGLETITPGYPIESYWRNEQVAQPILDGSQRRYLISGFGDGALVDLCRLTIERFRQDTIVYELFDPDLSTIEARFFEEIGKLDKDANVFELFRSVEEELLSSARQKLRDRIRKDTAVTLHLRGRNAEIKTFSQIFGRHSSFLHRLITFLLYRCGAFAIEFSKLDEAIDRQKVARDHVLCRYGAKTLSHLHALFLDPQVVSDRLAEVKERKLQTARRQWSPGVFRHYSMNEE